MRLSLNTEASGKEGSVLILTRSVKHFPREPEPKLYMLYRKGQVTHGATPPARGRKDLLWEDLSRAPKTNELHVGRGRER